MNTRDSKSSWFVSQTWKLQVSGVKKLNGTCFCSLTFCDRMRGERFSLAAREISWNRLSLPFFSFALLFNFVCFAGEWAVTIYSQLLKFLHSCRWHFSSIKKIKNFDWSVLLKVSLEICFVEKTVYWHWLIPIDYLKAKVYEMVPKRLIEKHHSYARHSEASLGLSCWRRSLKSNHNWISIAYT